MSSMSDDEKSDILNRLENIGKLVEGLTEGQKEALEGLVPVVVKDVQKNLMGWVKESFVSWIGRQPGFDIIKFTDDDMTLLIASFVKGFEAANRAVNAIVAEVTLKLIQGVKDTHIPKYFNDQTLNEFMEKLKEGDGE